MKILEEIKNEIDNMETEEKFNYLEKLKEEINKLHPLIKQPTNNIKWIPIEKVEPNNYNPNSVATKEMKLLYVSIKHDGLTQPIVAMYNKEKDKYIIVDGFHRYFVCKENKDIRKKLKGRVPIAEIEKNINDRMASTIRHNRARGKHSIDGLGSMVFAMKKNGATDSEICNELGMEAEEVLRLKHITGFSKLFKDHKYNDSWETAEQIKIRKSK